MELNLNSLSIRIKMRRELNEEWDVINTEIWVWKIFKYFSRGDFDVKGFYSRSFCTTFRCFILKCF